MIAETQNFLDKSTSCNDSDMLLCDVGTPPQVTTNLLHEASRFFTLIILTSFTAGYIPVERFQVMTFP